MKWGYTCSSEEFEASDLARLAVQAEDAGFEFVTVSDHFHPWTDSQGHSPFAWSTVGVESLDHVGALVDRVIGRAGQRVFEEVACAVRSGDEFLDRGDLPADHAAPLVAGFVEHGRGRVQTDAKALHQLDERQPAQVFTPVHALAAAALRGHQPPVLVIAQRRRVEREQLCGLTDRHELHVSI